MPSLCLHALHAQHLLPAFSRLLLFLPHLTACSCFFLLTAICCHLWHCCPLSLSLFLLYLLHTYTLSLHTTGTCLSLCTHHIFIAHWDHLYQTCATRHAQATRARLARACAYSLTDSAARAAARAIWFSLSAALASRLAPRTLRQHSAPYMRSIVWRQHHFSRTLGACYSRITSCLLMLLFWHIT